MLLTNKAKINDYVHCECLDDEMLFIVRDNILYAGAEIVTLQRIKCIVVVVVVQVFFFSTIPAGYIYLGYPFILLSLLTSDLLSRVNR